MREGSRKKRAFIRLLLTIFVIGGLIGAGVFIQQTKQPKEEEEAVTAVSQPENELEQRVTALLNEMTLEEKIGQLTVVGFQSKEVDHHIKTMLQKHHVGGVILYDRNMESPKQVARLTKELQALAQEQNQKIPLLVSIDQEGGKIVRMREHVSPIPSQQELARRGSLESVYETAARSGAELKEMGIDVNYAPVLDLSASDSRSFGTDPKKAEAFGKQAIKGFYDAGVTATLKHFPGHGRSDIDPHVESSSVEADRLDLETNDIYPFKAIMNDIDHQQFFVMVTHIKYPAYDKENPASLSPIIIQKLLREKLDYQGIVVTDDLEMGAVTEFFPYKELGSRAIEAGADLLLVCHTLEHQQEVIGGIVEAVKEKKLSEERIDQSVKRILAYKLEADGDD